ncbi:helix-turn-helix domain-containing protein [Methylobacterium sp. WL64]|uniref:winged helix-turn-helix transcriptional regulator n=1 Tax=Methylobacterium sp. WL64 TaxID=2603894 RepID=UPI001FEFD775|nr:helix-turn-helix domain-containing protein [Methylobacterium sp. WL64]
MQDRNEPDDPCSALTPDAQALVREVLARLVDKWGLWVLSELSENGPLRFSRLLERVRGVSQKSLTATLRQLERDGLVTRTMVVQVPIRVDYAVTPLGRSLVEQVQPLWLWAIARLPEFVAARAAYDANVNRRQVP